MDNLVKIEQKLIGQELVDAVDARELHDKLEVKTLFKDWINRRLSDTMSEENKDYIVLYEMAESSLLKTEQAQQSLSANKKEYIITLDLAKHISMVEKTETGRKIRQYFIDYEKETRTEIENDLIMSLRKKQIVIEKEQKKLEQKQVKQQLELINHQQQLLDHQQKQIETFSRIIELERSNRVLEAKADAIIDQSDYYSVLGYANLIGSKMPIESASKIGRKASKMSKNIGLEIGSVKDPRYGKVNTYHRSILKELVL